MQEQISGGEPLGAANGASARLTVDRNHLRVLVANQREERIALVSALVTGLGHTVVASSTDVTKVGALTTETYPDVALVGLGSSASHALHLIERIVSEAECPVIALLASRDAGFVTQAAKRGVFAYIVDSTGEDLQSALDVTLSRFAEYHDLQGAFGRRARVERAKGILMERHRVDERAAFELLRSQSRNNGRKIVDVAQAVIDGHTLLPTGPRT